MNSPWRCLEEMRSLAGVLVEWQQFAGESLTPIRRAFLQKANRKASSYPCPIKEGCFHQVVPRGDRFVGVYKHDQGTGCEDLDLSAEDVEVWEVNSAKLRRAVARAFQCEFSESSLGLHRTWQIASFGASSLPIILTVQNDKDDFLNVVLQLSARLTKGYVLLAPTNQFCTAMVLDAIDRAKAGFFDLQTKVQILESGRLIAHQTGGELFSNYLPEMEGTVRESDLKDAFRLYQELLGMGNHLKAPLARVFDLIVSKQKSKSEAATACKCSPSLITKRVDQIENHFHLSINTLQGMASEILERDRTVKGDRYAKKKRGSQQNESDQYDGESYDSISGQDQDDESDWPE